jgi:ribosomal-protein-alanine N-acetyltransferase
MPRSPVLAASSPHADAMNARAPYVIARLAGEEDLADVAALEAASFSNPWSLEMLSREVQNTAVSRVYVMRDRAGMLVAFCACWFLGDEIHINTLAVSAGERRRGHATRLLRFVFREAAHEGLRRATLEVRRSNEAALNLYAGLGFEVRGVRRNYYQTPEEDALVLWSDELGKSD